MPFKIFQLVANLNKIIFAGFDSTPSNSLTNKVLFIYVQGPIFSAVIVVTITYLNRKIQG